MCEFFGLIRNKKSNPYILLTTAFDKKAVTLKKPPIKLVALLPLIS